METLQEKIPLSECFSNLFILAAALKTAKDLGSPDTLRSKIIEMFGQAERASKTAGATDEIYQQAKYAAAALLDELILSSPWSFRDQWSARPLQYEFFRDNLAGVEFFNKMDLIRRALPLNRDLLEIYCLCLTMGFEGKFKIHDRERLNTLLEEAGKELRAEKKESVVLSPHGKRPEEFIQSVKQGLPVWVVLVSATAIVLLFFLTLSFMVSHEANRVASGIQQLEETKH